MGRVVGGLVVLLVAMMAPNFLVAGALGAMASASQAGSSSALVTQLQAAGYENGRLPDEVEASDRSVISNRYPRSSLGIAASIGEHVFDGSGCK
jgi:hypothetical protein